MCRTLRCVLVIGVLALVTSASVAQELSGCSPKQSDGAIRIGCSMVLESKVLGEQRRLNVYLPPGYDEGETRYPVLYLLDGGVHEDFVHIAGIASLAADFRKIRSFIVVGIEGRDRYHDLLTSTSVEEEQKRWPTAGGAAAFRRFLVREVVPHVRGSLRTTEETILLGESAAGHFVVETLLRSPEAFAAYAAVSPSLWWDRQSLSKAADGLLAEKPPQGRRLFLAIADEGGEMREATDQVARSVSALGSSAVEMRYEPMDEESHGTILHPAALRAVRWLLATPSADP